MSQIQLICLMEVHHFLTSWEAVTTASLHQRLLPKTIFFSVFVTIITVYYSVNTYLVSLFWWVSLMSTVWCYIYRVFIWWYIW